MRTDAQGLALTTDSDAAVTAFDDCVEAVAKYRLDATPASARPCISSAWATAWVAHRSPGSSSTARRPAASAVL